MKLLCVAMMFFSGFVFGEIVPEFIQNEKTISIVFNLKPGEHVYSDGLEITPKPEKMPTAKDVGGLDGWDGKLEFTVPLAPVTITYTACDNLQCYMPQTKTWTPSESVVVLPEKSETSVIPEKSWKPKGFSYRQAGTMNESEFLSFVRGENSQNGFFEDPVGYVKENGLWIVLVIVFFGGGLLNLTPCVLPMIPINLAIIGAGVKNSNRLQGYIRGSFYGLGISLAYGALGVISVLTGSAFGSLQSSPWFNLAITVIFVVLALSLFDLFFIDFTKFSGGGGGAKKKGNFAAFTAGAISAVLAGACVAPVLIAVLLVTADYYAQGYFAALALPFVLGLGMALPWPIAGAGLSFLPKPGAWMTKVKYLFGVLVLFFAAYYGLLAYKGFRPAQLPENGIVAGDFDAWNATFEKARTENKPVLVDFWASWCKNCIAMEHSVFAKESVKAELKDVIVLKVQTEHPTETEVKKQLDAYGIKGLPTILFFTPENNKTEK